VPGEVTGIDVITSSSLISPHAKWMEAAGKYRSLGAETGGRAGAWPTYGFEIYIEYLNFD